MTNLQKLFKNQDKEFEKTMLITKGGSWLECSDYEETVEEIKKLRLSERLAILQEIDKMCEEMKGKISKIHFPDPRDGNYYSGFEAGKELALDEFSSLQSEIKKLIELQK